MAEDTDFVALYAELGVDAACTIEQLKQAYRRRVGQLHPDAVGHAEGTGRLQRLNQLYSAAIAFHREHGRLPGGPATPVFATRHRPQSASHRGPPRQPGTLGDGDESSSGDGLRSLLLAGIGIVVLAWVFLARDRAPPADSQATTPQAQTGDTGLRHPIDLGMSEPEVEQALGEPTDVHGTRWNYGPSWVEFHCGKLDGWYSSPLRPLRVPSSAMHAREIWASRPDKAGRCEE